MHNQKLDYSIRLKLNHLNHQGKNYLVRYLYLLQFHCIFHKVVLDNGQYLTIKS